MTSHSRTPVRHHQTELGRLLYPGEGARSGRWGVQFAGMLRQPAAECVHPGNLGAAAAAEGALFNG